VALGLRASIAAGEGLSVRTASPTNPRAATEWCFSQRRQGDFAEREGVGRRRPLGLHYGLAVKIGSDGDITVYYEGKEFIRM